MESIKIIVDRTIDSKSAVRESEATKLFDEIISQLNNNKIVVLDFSDITLVTSAFLNVAIGRLYGKEEYSDDFIKIHIKIEGLDENDLVIYHRVVKRAKEYFSGDKEKMINSIREILGEESDD